ncbi:MAG TPA: hypothetical protein VLC53_20250, partial [Myxococcota bacterium]|nr:hypothetical protein [Myxococcota bacterium]
MKPLAQDRLHGGLPAGVDAKALPEARQRSHAVPLVPSTERFIIAHRFLDLAQGRQLRLRGGMLALDRRQRLGRGGTRLVQRGALRLQRFHGTLRLLHRPGKLGQPGGKLGCRQLVRL